MLTNDGDFAFQMTHPKFHKEKIYEVELNKPLQPLHQQMISDYGILLDDGPSKFDVFSWTGDGDGRGPQNVLRSKNFGEGESPAGPAESKILSDETSATMRDLLIHNRDYTARYGIDRSGYDIGGKSGTAQVVKNGAYDDTMSELVGGYAGFIAPTGALPEYVILTKMWGEGQAVGSGDAMSLFDDLSNFVINYTKLKPGV